MTTPNSGPGQHLGPFGQHHPAHGQHQLSGRPFQPRAVCAGWMTNGGGTMPLTTAITRCVLLVTCRLIASAAHVRSRALPRRRDERGLSQSTENAILLAGAVTVATLIIVAITAYVRKHLPK